MNMLLFWLTVNVQFLHNTVYTHLQLLNVTVSVANCRGGLKSSRVRKRLSLLPYTARKSKQKIAQNALKMA